MINLYYLNGVSKRAKQKGFDTIFNMKPVVHTQFHLLPYLFARYKFPLSLQNTPQTHRFFLPQHHWLIPTSLSAISMEAKSIERKQASNYEKSRKDKRIEEVDDEEEEEDERGGKSGGRGGSSVIGGVSSSLSCQAERCGADLNSAKRYHRRHKVCEFHSKASVVMVTGLRQRFCQQCSRFHDLGEFDEAKRSCRRRLAEHNERRRKSSAENYNDGSSKDHHHNSMEGRYKHVDERGKRVHQMSMNSGCKSLHIK